MSFLNNAIYLEEQENTIRNVEASIILDNADKSLRELGALDSNYNEQFEKQMESQENNTEVFQNSIQSMHQLNDFFNNIQNINIEQDLNVSENVINKNKMNTLKILIEENGLKNDDENSQMKLEDQQEKDLIYYDASPINKKMDNNFNQEEIEELQSVNNYQQSQEQFDGISELRLDDRQIDEKQYLPDHITHNNVQTYDFSDDEELQSVNNYNQTIQGDDNIIRIQENQLEQFNQNTISVNNIQTNFYKEQNQELESVNNYYSSIVDDQNDGIIKIEDQQQTMIDNENIIKIIDCAENNDQNIDNILDFNKDDQSSSESKISIGGIKQKQDKEGEQVDNLNEKSQTASQKKASQSSEKYDQEVFEKASSGSNDSDYLSEDEYNFQLQKKQDEKLWKQLRRATLIQLPQSLQFNNNDKKNQIHPQLQSQLQSLGSFEQSIHRMESTNENTTQYEDDIIEEVNQYVIMPDSQFKGMWNGIIIFYMIYTATILPYRVCFIDDYSSFYYYFEYIMNIVFGMDILVSFLSAYYDEDNVLVTSNKYIAVEYLKGWFLIDIISVIPINDIIDQTQATADQNQQNATQNSGQYNSLIRLARLPRLYRLVRLLRLVRLAKFKKVQSQGIISQISNAIFKMNASIKRMFKTMGLAILAIHLSACFYFLVGKIDDYSNQNSWIYAVEEENSDPMDQYVTAVYWSIQTLTTVGFGDVPAQSNGEMIFAVLWMGVSGAFFSFMVSNLQGAVDDNNDNSIEAKLNRLMFVQNELKLPEELVKQIKTQMDFTHKQLKNLHIVHNLDFIDQLPTTLKAHILICVYANVLKKIPFFIGKDIQLIMTYIPHLSAVYYQGVEVIYNPSDHPEEVYFVYQGKVILEDENRKQIHEYNEQDIFGDLEIICNMSRICKIVTTNKTILFTMSQSKFIKMILDYPEIHPEIRSIYDNKRKTLEKYMSEEDKLITSIPFDNLVQQWKEKYDNNGNIELSLKKCNVQKEQYIQFNQQTLHKSDQLLSIFTKEKEFDEKNKYMYFDEIEDYDKFIDELSSHFSSDFSNSIDQLLKESEQLNQTIKKKIEYYKIMKYKLIEIIQKFDNLAQE